MCQLAKAIAVPAATICLFLFSVSSKRILDQIDSLVKRQIVISADPGGWSDSVGSRVLLVSARLQVLLFVELFGTPPLEIFLGQCKKGPAVSKRSSGFLCVFYIGHVSHTVPPFLRRKDHESKHLYEV